jgi:hypothetical protein
MLLKENKRLKTDEDKITLKQFKLDIFDETKPINQTLKKYFKFTDDIKTINNIAYRNETCNTVSKTIRKLLQKQSDYEQHEVLVCRQYTKIKGCGVFHVNYEYKIIKITNDSIGLRDASDNKADVMMIPKATAENNFIHGYCRTCHSYQGSSMTIILLFLIGILSMSIESGYIQQLQGRQNYLRLNFIMVNVKISKILSWKIFKR